MAYVANNPILYNAAYNGFVSGALSGVPVQEFEGDIPLPPTYYFTGSLGPFATAFAEAVDTAIATDATITTAGSPNVTIAPTTGSIQEKELGKAGLMFALCSAALAKNVTIPNGSVPGSSGPNFANIAAGIVNAYTNLVGGLLTP